MTNLSKRAQTLLIRIQRGEFYPAYRDVPDAMHELEKAGLVTVIGRVETVSACYVPTKDYIPYQRERYLNIEDERAKQVSDLARFVLEFQKSYLGGNMSDRNSLEVLTDAVKLAERIAGPYRRLPDAST